MMWPNPEGQRGAPGFLKKKELDAKAHNTFIFATSISLKFFFKQDYLFIYLFVVNFVIQTITIY